MDYRNERDALRGRVENLEQALEEARADQRGDTATRVARLEKQLADAAAVLRDIQRELSEVRGQEDATSPPPRERPDAGLAAQRPVPGPRSDARRWALAAVLACLALAVLVVARSVKHRTEPSPRISVQPLEAVLQPLAPVAEASQIAKAPEPQATPVAAEPRYAKARWPATVRRAEGIALSPGARCFIDATIEATGTRAHVMEVELRCGIQTLYTSSISRYRSDLHDDVRERLGRRDDEGTFTLQYGDEARNGNQTSKVDLDSTKGTAVVHRRISLEWRVELTMPSQSLPTAPLSGPSQRLRRTGRVTDASGGATIGVGSTCVLRAMPTGKDEQCVAEVRCGSAVLVPSDTEVTCTYDGARPVGVSLATEPLTLRLEGQTLEVRTRGSKGSRVVIALEAEGRDPPAAGR